jgi:hypothetical protein
MSTEPRLSVVLNEWARPEFPGLARNGPAVPEELIRLGLLTGMLTRDEVRCLLGLAATA